MLTHLTQQCQTVSSAVLGTASLVTFEMTSYSNSINQNEIQIADLSAIFEVVRVVNVRYDCFGGHSADAVDSLHTANLGKKRGRSSFRHDNKLLLNHT